MPEIQKYNLKKELYEADKKYAHSPAVAGMSSLTHYRYNNSTRTQMFTSHLNQFLNQPDPQFPFSFTGAENVVGRNSSGYKKLKGDIIVYRKVEKYKEIVENPFVYQLFFYDTRKERYDVVKRQAVKDLGQNYGYMYNNDFIDSLKEGDKVKKGKVLFKSTSYDESMNYRYGQNLRTIYSFDPFVEEDAAIISESASIRMSSIHSKILSWNWNQNDIPLNVFGNDDVYQPLPYIGQYVEGHVAASRSQINEQLLYDFTNQNLQMVKDSDRKVVYQGRAQVLDFDIFCNGILPEDSFNHQILEYIDAQTRYWQEIQDTCLEIMNSGKDYSNAIDRLYKRSIYFTEDNPNRKWHNGNSIFGHLEFRCHVFEISPLAEGGKFTARFGNKSVVSKVLPDHEMPFTSDGKRVDVILSQPAISNRTTGFVPHEMQINWITELAVDEMKKMDNIKDQENLLFDLMHDFNADEEAKFHRKYNRLSDKRKQEFIQDVIDSGGIHIHQDSVNEDVSIFFKLMDIGEKYKFIEPKTLFIYRWGHIYRICHKFCPGKMYYITLRQTDSKGFSARNTGAINMKELPERSYRNKRNEAPFSDTAIRFGEYESLNYLIGLEPEELAILHGVYRSSPEATSDLTKAQFMKRGMRNFKKFYKSRAAEIFSVYYKHLGLELQFRDRDKEVHPYSSRNMTTHTYKGKTYMMSDYDFEQMRLKDRIKTEILNQKIVMSGKELEKEADEYIAKGIFLTGPKVDVNIFGTREELEDKEDPSYIPTKQRMEEKKRKLEEIEREREEHAKETEKEFIQEDATHETYESTEEKTDKAVKKRKSTSRVTKD